MKCASLLNVACLTAVTLAAVPFYDKRNAEQTAESYWKPNTSPVPYNSSGTLDSDDTDTLPSNLTAPTARNDTPLGPGQWAIDFRIGGPEQHAGTLGGKRLYNQLMDAFRNLGLSKRDNPKFPNSPVDCPSQDFCKSSHPCCLDGGILEPIVYQAKGGAYATNAHLKVAFWWAEIHDTAHPGLRQLAYHAAARIISMSTEIEENCYYVNFKNSRKTKFCNIPYHTMIIIPSNGAYGAYGGQGAAGPTAEVVLNIITKFNGDTSHKGWNGEALLKRAKTLYEEETRPGITKILGYGEKDMHFLPYILEDKCFDTRKGNYKLNAPWKEPNIKGCI